MPSKPQITKADLDRAIACLEGGNVPERPFVIWEDEIIFADRRTMEGFENAFKEQEAGQDDAGGVQEREVS